MQTKIIFILLILIAFIVALFQRSKIKDLKEDNRLYQSQLENISKNNKINLLDLQTRNEELSIKNQELKVLYESTETISKTYNDKYNNKEINNQDCINQSINIDIKQLLQKAGI